MKRTIAGIQLVSTTYNGDHAWITEYDGRITFYLDFTIPVPAPRGSRIRSGRNYAAKWKCNLAGQAYPYIGAWFETITEIVERLDREGLLRPNK